jgi:2-polyprenyl-3-methyl-5-hydroxy-6-metoxy-1,4-benzoquinol methylase
MYLNPRLTENRLVELYNREYYDGKGFDPHVSYLADLTKSEDAEKVFNPAYTVQVLKELVPTPAKLLDFGCGVGDLIRQAQSQGYEVSGFEVSPFAARLAASSGVTVYNSTDDIPSGTFDAVSCVEVLEHCHSPLATLRSILRFLKPGGLFYYTSGNFDGFYLKWRFGLAPKRLTDYVVPEGHIYFFSTRVMKAYLRKAGFTKVFSYRPLHYSRDTRVYKALARMRLVDSDSELPRTAITRAAYSLARAVANGLLMGMPPLPLAVK